VTPLTDCPCADLPDGEHRLGLGRSWCHACGEWCYDCAPVQLCTRGEQLLAERVRRYVVNHPRPASLADLRQHLRYDDDELVWVRPPRDLGRRGALARNRAPRCRMAPGEWTGRVR
jgi:hypothetical protein